MVLSLTIDRSLSPFDNIVADALFCRNVGLYQDLRHAARADVASWQHRSGQPTADRFRRKSLRCKALSRSEGR